VIVVSACFLPRSQFVLFSRVRSPVEKSMRKKSRIQASAREEESWLKVMFRTFDFGPLPVARIRSF